MIAQDWQDNLERIASELGTAAPAGCASLIRQIHRLLCSAPTEVAAAIGMPCRADVLEGYLRADAECEAAFALLGRAQYMLSRNGSGHVIATVLVPDLFPETRRDGADEASAIAGALAEGLRDWARAMVSISPSRATH